ncbi:hypothetical protein [Streptomyces sp. NPDC008139]|uniref:hypothetical protein n=1 Tax=Streptomyces sp. NPDC008139 TaxID=3364814 RepID=UPI0036E6DF1C
MRGLLRDPRGPRRHRRGAGAGDKIFPICEFLEAHPYTSAIKTGVDLVGVPGGPPRLPTLPLAQEHANTLARLLRSAGIELAR